MAYSALEDFGAILEEIIVTEDQMKLLKLALDYLDLYKVLSKEIRYSQSEEQILSTFFIECDAYTPESDKLWNTKFAVFCSNSEQLKSSAKETIAKLSR